MPQELIAGSGRSSRSFDIRKIAAGHAVRSTCAMPFRFEWDPLKAFENRQKHGVGFEEAIAVFHDPLGLTAQNAMHSIDEIRWATIGAMADGRLVVVFHTDRGDTIRVISARLPTRPERRAYEEEPL